MRPPLLLHTSCRCLARSLFLDPLLFLPVNAVCNLPYLFSQMRSYYRHTCWHLTVPACLLSCLHRRLTGPQLCVCAVCAKAFSFAAISARAKGALCASVASLPCSGTTKLRCIAAQTGATSATKDLLVSRSVGRTASLGTKHRNVRAPSAAVLPTDLETSDWRGWCGCGHPLRQTAPRQSFQRLHNSLCCCVDETGNKNGQQRKTRTTNHEPRTTKHEPPNNKQQTRTTKHQTTNNKHARRQPNTQAKKERKKARKKDRTTQTNDEGNNSDDDDDQRRLLLTSAMPWAKELTLTLVSVVDGDDHRR